MSRMQHEPLIMIEPNAQPLACQHTIWLGKAASSSSTFYLACCPQDTQRENYRAFVREGHHKAIHTFIVFNHHLISFRYSPLSSSLSAFLLFGRTIFSMVLVCCCWSWWENLGATALSGSRCELEQKVVPVTKAYQLLVSVYFLKDSQGLKTYAFESRIRSGVTKFDPIN